MAKDDHIRKDAQNDVISGIVLYKYILHARGIKLTNDDENSS